MSCAKIGSSAVAEAKKVATKSSSMVERTMGCANTNRRPSRAAAQVTCEAGAPAACGRARMTSSAAITIRKETAFTAYTHAMPGPAITRPARVGPATEANWNTSVLSPMALARCSRGTRLGMSAWRAGPSKEAADDDTGQHRERDDRHDLDGAHEPERDSFALGRGEERHVPQDGRGLHPRSSEGEELTDPQQREIAMPQGGEGVRDAARERQTHRCQATRADPPEPPSRPAPIT